MATPDYADLNTLHNPSVGGKPPASWGDQTRDNFEALARPAGCIATRTSTQSISNTTLTAIQFDAADVRDTDAFHDTSTNNTRITVPAGLGGLYRVGASVQFAANSTGGRTLRLRANGTTVLASVDLPANTGTNITSLMIEIPYSLVATDYVEALVYQDRGGALNICSSFAALFWAIRAGVS